MKAAFSDTFRHSHEIHRAVMAAARDADGRGTVFNFTQISSSLRHQGCCSSLTDIELVNAIGLAAMAVGVSTGADHRVAVVDSSHLFSQAKPSEGRAVREREGGL